VIFYYSEEQKQIAQKVFEELKDTFLNPIVTELSEVPEFHMADLDHQNYYNENSGAGYCRVVIDPKIAKIRDMYADKMK
jgi:peptide-methionine (S)-S-oxide reductase